MSGRASPDKTPLDRQAWYVTENRRLRAEVVRLRGNRDFLEQHVLRLEAMLGERDVRVKRLREALQRIVDGEAWSDHVRIAEEALFASPDKPPGGAA